jgi:hypothetical protein
MACPAEPVKLQREELSHHGNYPDIHSVCLIRLALARKVCQWKEHRFFFLMKHCRRALGDDRKESTRAVGRGGGGDLGGRSWLNVNLDEQVSWPSWKNSFCLITLSVYGKKPRDRFATRLALGGQSAWSSVGGRIIFGQ